ncbi:MAG: DUF1554 domain-containing protein [Leptospiraceae bacterium]|nr:DUF1554 domain-containing protein [Leptospiraceae bacterium]
MKTIVQKSIKLLLLLTMFSHCTQGKPSSKILALISLEDPEKRMIELTYSPSLITDETSTTFDLNFKTYRKPKEPLSFTLSSNLETEGILSTSTVSITENDYTTNKTVKVTGVPDFVKDGDQEFQISFTPIISKDTFYSGYQFSTIKATNKDTDTASIRTSINGSKLETNESGTTASFTVVLTSKPSSTVTIPTITSSNTTEGTVSPSSLTFDASNWNVPQTVTITGVDDITPDGIVYFTIDFGNSTSTDSNYNALTITSLNAQNVDNEPAFVIGTVSGNTSEGGGTANFTFRLARAPSSDVVIALSSSNTQEGTVSPSTLTFTNLNWSTNQNVTITGVDDFVQDGTIAYSIITAPATSSDVSFHGLDPNDVSLSNTDNDTAAITITQPPQGILVTDSTVVASSINVSLATQPVADVTINVSSSDLTEGTVSVASLTFNSSNWSTPQIITVTGVNDSAVDGNQNFTIDLSSPISADTNYSALGANSLNASSCDNDTGGTKITACRVNGTTNEGGGTATLYVFLSQAPTSNVTVPTIASSDTTEGTVSATSLVITPATWNTLSNVITVTGANDSIYDGNINYNVTFGNSTSADGFFNNVPVSSLSFVNNDDDNAFVVTPITSVTTELAATATFNVRLYSAPSASVTVNLQSSNTAEGTVSPASLVFTTGNWNTNQLVTVTGVDDTTADGNQNFDITASSVTSADLIFNGATFPAQSMTNIDNDRRMYITSTLVAGNTSIANADTLCNSDASKPAGITATYKALLVDNVLRVASVTANAGDGQVDWVIGNTVRYYRANGTTIIATSNGNRLLPFALTTSFDGTTNTFWTGLNTNWVAHANNCTAWTSNSGAVMGRAGIGNVTTFASISNSSPACNTSQRILCVGQ